jgi:uncharacterized protein
MKKATGGRFRIAELTPAECRAVLERNKVLRLAYAFRNVLDIQPLHYVLDGQWLYGRTSAGLKLTTVRHNRWIAFEVDEIRSPLDWTSVVGRGSFNLLAASGPSHEVRARQRGIRLLRQVIPGAFTRADPVAHRSVVFRIHVHELSGREARGLA